MKIKTQAAEELFPRDVEKADALWRPDGHQLLGDVDLLKPCLWARLASANTTTEWYPLCSEVRVGVKWLAQGQDPECFVNKMIKPSEDWWDKHRFWGKCIFSGYAYELYNNYVILPKAKASQIHTTPIKSSLIIWYCYLIFLRLIFFYFCKQFFFSFGFICHPLVKDSDFVKTE